MSGLQSASPAAIKRIAKEITDLRANPLEDIVLIPNEDNIMDVQAWIQGPGFFRTRIFHPNVSEQGEICVSTLKKDWKSDLGVKHLLLTIKCLLIVPNPESALNEEAGRLLLEDYESFSKHARLITSLHAANKGVEFPLSTVAAEQSTDARSKASGEAVGAARKRGAEDKTAGGVGNAASKAAADKKRALRRL
nr:ubiquitin-conjugating enzyme E2 S [Polyrhizophydium stewartii]